MHSWNVSTWAAAPGNDATEAFDVNNAKMCLLIVDDEPDIRDEMNEYFSGKGFDVLEAGNGVEALTKFRQEPVDAILTDMRMPRSMGYELIAKVRETDAEIPIIVVTGHNSESERVTAINAGANAVFVKPLRLRDIAETLCTLLDRDPSNIRPK